jgi:hypothetical protein
MRVDLGAVKVTIAAVIKGEIPEPSGKLTCKMKLNVFAREAEEINHCSRGDFAASRRKSRSACTSWDMKDLKIKLVALRYDELRRRGCVCQ